MTTPTKNLLLIYLKPPPDLEKSAQLLPLKYLRELGWQTTVLAMSRVNFTPEPLVNWCGIDMFTVYPSESRLWRLSQSLYRIREQAGQRRRGSADTMKVGPVRLPRSVYWSDYALLPATTALSFPDKYRHAALDLLKMARRLHSERNFQAVISIYDPITAHIVGRRLAEEAGIPWIARNKDWYSKYEALMYTPITRVRNWFKRPYEKALLSKTSALLGTNENMSEYLKGMCPHAITRTVTHCYDDVDFDGYDPETVKSNGKFTMVSFGVGQTDRDDDVFFRALGELLREGAIDPQSFRVKFMGRGMGFVRTYSREYGCTELVEAIPPVPHEQAMNELKHATCLYYSQDYVASRRRLPEYLAAQKPILAWPSCPGAWSEGIFARYGAAVMPTDKEGIKATLLEWYRIFKAQGRLQLPLNQDVVRGFSARQVARDLRDVLEQVAASHG